MQTESRRDGLFFSDDARKVQVWKIKIALFENLDPTKTILSFNIYFLREKRSKHLNNTNDIAIPLLLGKAALTGC